MKRTRAASAATVEVVELLGASVRARRIRRRWSQAELAERVGVSVPTLARIERGDPRVAIGAVVEAAVIVGLPLFDADPAARSRQLHAVRTELALLPAAARSTKAFDDDF